MNDAFYKHLLDEMYDGVYFVDRHRRILYWNGGAERLSGYSADEVTGRFCGDNLLRHIDECGRRLCTDMLLRRMYATCHLFRLFFRHQRRYGARRAAGRRVVARGAP